MYLSYFRVALFLVVFQVVDGCISIYVVRIGRDCLPRRGSFWLAIALLVGKGVKSQAGGVAYWLAGGVWCCRLVGLAYDVGFEAI